MSSCFFNSASLLPVFESKAKGVERGTQHLRGHEVPIYLQVHQAIGHVR